MGHGEPVQLPAVRWLSPTELVRTGVTVLLGSTVAAYADKRDVMAGTTFAQGVPVYEAAGGGDGAGEFWFDVLCDTGDGFRAMATVATLLGAPEIAVDGQVLPRGRVLLLGGDEVYPVAGTLAYEQRLESPLDEQFVADPGTDPPTMYAIPGNHDWYDGLTAFLRVFCQGRHVAGWDTDQRRSYFALALPRGWWVLAIDIQLDTYVDATQLAWFREVVATIPDGDRIVLLTATPAWYGAQDGDDRSMDRLAFFLREVLGDRDLPIRLVLTGDTHHYAVYTLEHPEQEQVLVTAGHGGAYTSPTHFLPAALDVTTDLAAPGPRRATGTHRYVRGPRTFPTAATSRAEAVRVLWRLPLRNGLLLPLLVLLPALVIVPWVVGVPAVSVIAGVGIAAATYGFVMPQRAGRAPDRPRARSHDPGAGGRRRRHGRRRPARRPDGHRPRRARRGAAGEPRALDVPAARRARGQPQRALRRPEHRGPQGVPAPADRRRRDAHALRPRRGPGAAALAVVPGAGPALDAADAGGGAPGRRADRAPAVSVAGGHRPPATSRMLPVQ